jgi:hypothetical protein
MRNRIVFGTLLFCLGLLTVAQSAKADTVDGVSFTLVSANLSGSPTHTLTWQYDIVNDSGFSVFANKVDSSIWSRGVGDGSPFDFFAGSGFVILDQSSLMGGTLFSFIPDPGVSSSFNSGVFDLFVQLSDPNKTVIDLSAKYTATITSSTNVPEPGTLMLLSSGLLAGLLVIRRAAH